MPKTVETYRTTKALRDAGPTTTPRPSAWVRPWPEWPGAARGEDGPRLVGSGGGARWVATDALEEEYRRAVESRQVIRYSAKVNRRAFVSAVGELRTRGG
jgi:hypothetical protein